MNWKEIEKEYIENVFKNKDRYIKDYRETLEKVKNSKAIFRNKVVPYSYKPLFHTESDLKVFDKIGKTMLSIGDKVVDEYIKNPRFRDKFGFPKDLEELILIESGYDINVPMTRMDIFYENEDNFKFVEINTDGSSAMLEDNSFGEITLNTLAIKDLEENYSFKNLELIESWVEESLDIYFNKWEGKNKTNKPNVAIMDFKESATSVEFLEFKKAYERAGYNCKIVDPRELKYKEDGLYYEDYKIDIIYRRLVTFEMIDRMEDVKEFIKAYKSKKVCTIGSLRSQLIHNKSIFKVLHEEETLKLFTKEEQNFIKRHIPYTGDFSGDKKIYEKVLKEKDKYIMKPADMNVGQGVFSGKDFTEKEWEDKLKAAWNTDYIFQEFIQPSKREFLNFKSEDIVVEDLNSIIGIFMYGEKFTGLYTRIGKENVVTSVNGIRAANIVVKEN